MRTTRALSSTGAACWNLRDLEAVALKFYRTPMRIVQIITSIRFANRVRWIYLKEAMSLIDTKKFKTWSQSSADIWFQRVRGELFVRHSVSQCNLISRSRSRSRKVLKPRRTHQDSRSLECLAQPSYPPCPASATFSTSKNSCRTTQLQYSS